MEIYEGLVKKGHLAHTIYTNNTSLYSYFFYTLMEIPAKLPKDVDVYHAVTPMEAMWIPKNRSVVTFHDLFLITDPGKLGSGLGYSKWKRFIGTSYFKFAINIAKRCRKVVAVSEKTKKDLVNYLSLPEEKIVVIRSGIRPDLRSLRERDGVSKIGYLGQLDRRKRVDLLIELFRNHRLNSQLLIAGTGVEEERLKALAKGDNRIIFLGRIPDGELVDFYNDIDVLVFPTWLEGYGLPIVEAMACKRPVVVLRDAGIPDEVKNRCIVVEDLSLLFADQGYFETRCTNSDFDGNYKWAKTHDWDRCVDEYIKLYEDVINT